MPRATLNTATPTPLLREWAKATLASSEWKDALSVAASVSIYHRTYRGIDTVGLQFGLSRVMIYQVVCECLEVTDRVMDAVECFHQMASDLGREMNLHGESEWAIGELSRIP